MKHTFFTKKLAFQPVDPLDDGLRDMILEEQREHAIDLYGDDASAGDIWRAMDQDSDRLAFDD